MPRLAYLDVFQTSVRPLTCAVLAVFAMAWIAAPLPALGQDVIKGRVEEKARIINDRLEGRVVDAETGRPLADVEVTLPDHGFSMRTGPGGEYSVPRIKGEGPVIMSVTRPGYAPFSISISEVALPQFTIRLQKAVKMLVLDNQLRHLGDGSFSRLSNNAFDFRKPADGPALRIPFNLGDLELTDDPYLQIGSVIGIDTRMAHLMSRNRIRINASPMLVKLNGLLVAQVDLNGDNKRISLPRYMFRKGETNVLEIEAGYHYPEPGRLDYDDIELIHLVIYL